MCGFVAWIDRAQEADRGAVARMLAVIHHRGPDDEGTYFAGTVGFGFRRLAIIDLSPAGHQPMTSPDGRYTIVFNGEIYNYLELRRELVALGHSFSSGSDTEVLLHAYVAWGEACLARLNGMWSFLIHDRKSGQVFGARDRFGMKPLFWHKTPRAVLVASEIKAIRASGHYEGSISWPVCARFFHEQRLDDTHETFFDGIQTVPAAHFIRIDGAGAVQISCYWAPPLERAVDKAPQVAFAEVFEAAVAIHLRSDVPVGVNLSGGLDSTSIICSIARERDRLGIDQPLQAFCFAPKEFDESTYVAATLAQTGAVQRTLDLDARQIWDTLPKALWFQDEPVHSITAVVGFHLSALAARHGIKVVLNGQGADETLGGYPSYFRDYWLTVLMRYGLHALDREISAYCAVQGGSRRKLRSQVLVHAGKSSLRRLAIYRRAARRRQLARFAKNDWFEPDLVNALPKESTFEQVDLHSSLNHSICSSPLPLYLRVEDRNAMAHSVEARLPFLDPRVVELACTLPPEWKLRGPWNKYVLREAMRGRIPEIVRARPDKMGFPTPFTRWVREDLYEPIAAIIYDSSLKHAGPFCQAAICRDLERHRRGEIDVAKQLFDVLQFRIWRNLDSTVACETRR